MTHSKLLSAKKGKHQYRAIEMYDRSVLFLLILLLANSLGCTRSVQANIPFSDKQFDASKSITKEKDSPRSSSKSLAISENRRLKHEEFKTLLNLGRVSRAAEKYKSAIKFCRQALVVSEGDTYLGATDIAAAYNELAESYLGLGQLSKSRQILEQAIERLRKNSSNTCELCPGSENLAYFYDRIGRYNASEPIYRRLLAEEEAKYGVGSTSLLAPLQYLASNLSAQGNFSEAEKLCARALEISNDPAFTDALRKVMILNWCANFYTDNRQYDKAEKLYRDSLVLALKFSGLSQLDLKALDVVEDEQPTIEIPSLKEYRFDRCIEPSLHLEIATLNNLAILYHKERKFRLAKLTYELALRAAKQQHRIMNDDKEEAFILNNLAVLLDDQKQYVEAEKLYLESLSIKSKHWSESSPCVLNSQINYIALLKETNRLAEASKLRKVVRGNDTYKFLTRNI